MSSLPRALIASALLHALLLGLGTLLVPEVRQQRAVPPIEMELVTLPPPGGDGEPGERGGGSGEHAGGVPDSDAALPAKAPAQTGGPAAAADAAEEAAAPTAQKRAAAGDLPPAPPDPAEANEPAPDDRDATEQANQPAPADEAGDAAEPDRAVIAIAAADPTETNGASAMPAATSSTARGEGERPTGDGAVAGSSDEPPGAGAGQGAGSGAGGGGGSGSGDGTGIGNGTGPALQEHVRLHTARCYPRAARRRRSEGKAEVAFCIDGTGHPDEIRIHRSSGSSLLDDAATSCVIRGSAPFPARDICVQVAIDFRLR